RLEIKTHGPEPRELCRCAMHCIVLSGTVGSVVGDLFGDVYVLDVGFTHTGRGNFGELRFGSHVVDAGVNAVAHRGTDTTHQLVDDRQDAALVRDAAFDAFGDELVGIVGRILEIAIGRAIGHGAQATHA